MVSSERKEEIFDQVQKALELQFEQYPFDQMVKDGCPELTDEEFEWAITDLGVTIHYTKPFIRSSNR